MYENIFSLKIIATFTKGTRFDNNHIENKKLKSTNSFLVHGIGASVLLTTAYFIIVSLVESFDHAVTFFTSLAYLLIPLIVTFGVQIALFSFARQQSKLARQKSANITSTGGMSTASMILCCAHHLSEVAAFVGLTAVTLFFTTYQPVFILIGLVSNVIGILTVLLFMQKNALYYRQGFLTPVMRLNLSKARKIAIITAVIVVILAFVIVAFQQLSSANNSEIFILPAKTVSQSGLTIIATPQPFKYGQSIRISLALDTHSGAISYDLAQLARLQDSNGTIYAPTKWDGPAPGGHHVSGALEFPPLTGQPSSMDLVLKDVYGANWAFEWFLTQPLT